MSAPTTPGRCPYLLDADGKDIHGEAAALRAAGPAVRVVLPGGIAAWSVTEPELIRRLLTHPQISKDAHQHWPDYIAGEIPEDWPLRIWVDVTNALTAYGTEHSRLRRPLAAAFSTRRVRALASQITDITHALLDELALAGPDEIVDLRARFAWRLPLQVANLLLGVPDEFHDDFRDTVGTFFITNSSPEEAVAAATRVYELIEKLFGYKRRNGLADDVTSQLITAHDQGEISAKELADSIVLLLGAGHETTVNAITHTIVNLVTHPDQLSLATSETVPWAKAVSESLRHQAPVATVPLRFAVEDVHDEESGLTFARGDAIVINYAAVGRDPHIHGDSAATFDVTRPSHEHLAFGYGTHLCLGAELARIEIRIAMTELFARFPDLRLAVDPDELEPLPSLISNGHTHLPVILGPAA